MKLLIFCSIILFYIGYSLEASDKSYHGKINSIIDEVTKNLNATGKDLGLEPLVIPDVHEKDKKDNNVQEINLTNGLVNNVISLKRFGDAEISYGSGLMKAQVGIEFKNLEVNFNFDITAYGLNPKGDLTAFIPYLKVVLVASVDPININAVVDDLQVPSVGEIEILMTTSIPLYGEIIKALTGTMTALFQDEIVYFIGKKLKDKANELIQEFLKM